MPDAPSPTLTRIGGNNNACVIVFQGSLAKFSSRLLRRGLVDTGGKTLAEGGLNDLVWGIRFKADNLRAFQALMWPALSQDLEDILIKIGR